MNKTMAFMLHLRKYSRLVLIPMSLYCGVNALWAGAVHSLNNTAITLQPGKYEARAHSDFILNRGGGINVTANFRTGVIEDMLDVEGYIGTGKTNFLIGGQTKFNLLPDLPGQVGLAFIGGYSFIVDDYGGLKENHSINVFSGTAVASKQIETTFGNVVPYVGFQVEMLLKPDSNIFPLTGVIGSEWNVNDTTPWLFFSEFDFDINKSVFLLSGGAGYRF